MFPRNLTFLQFPPVLDLSALAELLPEATLKPVGPLEMASSGFISPFGRAEQDQLHHQIGDWIWLALGSEQKVLPAAVVDRALQERLDTIEAEQGRRVSGRERKRLKDDVLHELLPRAFVSASRLDLYINATEGLLVVDTAAGRQAEYAASAVRGLFGSFPAARLNAEVAPRSILTGWISGEPLPAGISLGEECLLRDPVEGGATVRCQHQELRCDEVDKHLEAGKQATQLALVYEDRLSFVLGDDLVVRKLKFLDDALDQLHDGTEDDFRAEIDARFALVAGEIGQLYPMLASALRISKVEA